MLAVKLGKNRQSHTARSALENQKLETQGKSHISHNFIVAVYDAFKSPITYSDVECVGVTAVLYIIFVWVLVQTGQNKLYILLDRHSLGITTMSDDNSTYWKIGGAILGVGLLLMVILLPLSFSDVEYYQVGNMITFTVPQDICILSAVYNICADKAS